MSFLQPWMLAALPLVLLPIIIHLINQWRYQTKQWAAMMFLLAANKMNRGYARLRQWLILGARMLAIAGLIFLISRPLASSFLGLAGGSRLDTTIVLLDRSPSMQQRGAGQQSKLDTGKRQLADALKTLGSSQWVLIDSNSMRPESFKSLDALIDSPSLRGSSATADIPKMLQSVVEYLEANKPGPTDVWICSDLRAADWSPDSGNWAAVRDALSKFPQSVKIHLLAYGEEPQSNLAVTVTEAKREASAEGEQIALSFRITQTGSGSESTAPRTVPVQIELDGARSELSVELTGRDIEVRNHRLALDKEAKAIGRIALPADQNAADNDAFFVVESQQARRVVLVTDDRDASRPLEIAASISPTGTADTQVDVVTPDQLDSLVLDGSVLAIWQAALPQAATAGAVTEFVSRGGQVLFFPPAELKSGLAGAATEYLGMSWGGWVQVAEPKADEEDEEAASKKVMVDNWRGDQDLLAATRSGVGLPVGQLSLRGYAELKGTFSTLASFTGGKPLLARVATDKGGVYFCTTSTDPAESSLAEDGIVLYAMIQRAIDQGQTALGNTTMRTAGRIESASAEWRTLVAGQTLSEGGLSSEAPWHAGIYESDEKSFAVNRDVREDQAETIDDKRLEQLFAGLDYSRVNDQAGSLSGIVREIWQWFCLLMIAALIAEAILCLPRKPATSAAIAGMQVKPS